MASPRNKKSNQTKLESELAKLQRENAVFNESERFAQIGHFEWNIGKKRIQSCSNTFAEIFKMSVTAVLKPKTGWSNIIAQVHPDDKQAFEDLFEKLSNFGVPDFEFRIVHKDGAIRNLYMSGIALPNSKQTAKTVIGVVQDITGQITGDIDYEYKESLALQAERITELGNFIYDEIEDQYIYASPGCARIHGVSEQEFIESVDSLDDDLSDVYEKDRNQVAAAYRDYFNTAKDCKVEYRIVRADGELRWIRELLVPLQKKDGKVSITRGVLQDITDHKNTELELREAKENLEELVEKRTRELAETVEQLQNEVEQRTQISAELEFLANHDPLTELPSLRLCKDRLERSLAEARRSQLMVAVMFVDLDGFKEINDIYGHETGDNVLRITANRIKAEIRETDTVARIGGDEFLVILAGLPGQEIADRIAANLNLQVSQAIRIGQGEVYVSASVGIAIFPDDGSDSQALISAADKAMYQVKKAGKNSFGYVPHNQLN